MAKVQIIMPVTLDGFLPDKNEKLMVWLNTDRNGFPYWEEAGYIQHVSALRHA